MSGRVYVDDVLNARKAFLLKYAYVTDDPDGMARDLDNLLRLDESYQTDVVLSEVQDQVQAFSRGLLRLRRPPELSP